MNTDCKAVLALASFHNYYAEFVKPAWCSNSCKLSVVMLTYRSTRPVVRFVAYMMSVHSEKISKDK